MASSVLTDLNSEPKGDAFGVQIASDVPTSVIDWRDPLAGRWIRFWPWPLGKQAKDVSFDATAANSPEGLEAARAERAERARLLYVGATRARDYLVLAARKVVTKKEQRIETEWLDELRADGGGPVMVVPATDVSTVRVNGVDHPVKVRRILRLRRRCGDGAVRRIRRLYQHADNASSASPAPERRRSRRRGDDRRGDRSRLADAVLRRF